MTDAGADVLLPAGGDAGAVEPSGGRRGGWRAWLLSFVQKPAEADLSTGRVTVYGVGAYTQSMLSDMPAFYLTPFLLEVVDMSPVAAGNLQLIAKVRECICVAVSPLADHDRERLSMDSQQVALCLPRARVLLAGRAYRCLTR